MKWFISNSNDLEGIIKRLESDEWLNIQALSYFYNNGKKQYPLKNSVITLVKKVDNIIDSLVVITSKGLIYPCFSSTTRDSEDDKIELIRLLGQIRVKLHGVLGLEEDVNFFDSVLFNRIRGRNDYLILLRDSLLPLNIDNELVIKKATIKDLNRLVPLEFEYQKEEVLLKPSDINKRAIKENFKNKLKNDDIYYIDFGNIISTKAGTTYKSKNFTLIGGVFTWRQLRNRGLGTDLLKFLINDQISKGYKSVLFVKRENRPALHIYKKLGFTQPKGYKINYYYN